MSKITLTDLATISDSVITAVNGNNAAITTALDNTLSLDGTAPNSMAADLDMNSQKVINLAAPTNDNDAARKVDVDGMAASTIWSSTSSLTNKTITDSSNHVSASILDSGTLPAARLPAPLEIANGNLGLSKTPAAGNKLDVNGTINATDITVNGSPVSTVSAVVHPVASRVAMAALDPTAVSAVFLYAEGGRNGLFISKTGSTPTDASEGIYIASDTTNYYWERQFSGPINVEWFGADKTGVADSTSAIQAAINIIDDDNGGNIWLPAGTYLVTSQINISRDRIHIHGDGKVATNISFVPTADATCFHVEYTNGTSTIVQGSIKDLSFHSSDTTYQKIAIHLVDASEFQLAQIGTVTPHWFGNQSIFVKINGRDILSARDWDVFADTPIWIGPIESPHSAGSAESLDQTNFHNMYLGSTNVATHPIIFVEDGAYLTQVSFTGFQSWVGGKYGFYWVDTTTTGVSNGLSFENVRIEQGADSTGWIVYIDKGSFNLQSFKWSGGQGGDRNGFYFRAVENVTLDSFFYTSSTKVALNVDSTVKRIASNNMFWQAGSTATTSGQRTIWESPKNPATAGLSPSFFWMPSSDAVASVVFAGAFRGKADISVAYQATTTLDIKSGFVSISCDDGTMCLAALSTFGSHTYIISDGLTSYGTAQGTASKHNIYWDAGSSTFKLENNRNTGTRIYKITQIG